MANSKLLKEAIADAKAVKETALANAKIALEEAFTPRLQSILSQKLRAEAEEVEKDDADQMQEELDSSDIGASDGKEPSGFDAHTDLSVGVKSQGGQVGSELDDYSKVKDLNEEDAMDGDKDAEIAELKARLAELEGEDDDEMDMSDEFSMDNDMEDDGEDYDVTGDEMEVDDEDEDDMDLEAIIRELESQLGDDSEKEEGMYEAEDEKEMDAKNENLADGSEAGTDKGEDPKVVVTNEEENMDDEKNEVIDLEEILREMEADMKDDKEKVDEEEDKEEMKKELNEAYNTIKSLQKTINEVNLLNAKLLFANKLFRAHNMTNEQKVKVIETLDRTKSVREVKLVYSTLAENFKYSSNKVAKKSITEGIASKVVKSTKPAAQKQVIAESADFSNRFKKLAGIIK
jgi:hypothetical protein